MNPFNKRLKVGLKIPVTQKLLKGNILTDELVRISSLDQEDQHDNRCHNNANILKPISDDSEKIFKYCHSGCSESSQEREKPGSSFDNEAKTDSKRNKGVPGKFCSQVMSQQPRVNGQIKEVSASGSRADMKRFNCFFCGSEFSTGGLLTRHLSDHTGEQLLSCVICKNPFTSEFELKSHLCSSESPQDRELLKCSQCDERFSKSEDLNLHLRIHTKGSLFSCSVCSTSCSDKETLIQHMRIHTRQTQFTCHVCGKDFAWRRHLTKHMEVHMKRKKVFRCRPCGAEFSTYYLLTKHKVVHQLLELSRGQTEENREENEHMESSADGDDFEGLEPTKHPNTEADSQERSVEASACFKAEEGDLWTESTKPEEAKEDLEFFTVKENQEPVFNKEEVKLEDLNPPQIKEEEEEAEITKFPFSSVLVKTEEDEEKPQSLQPHHCHNEESKNSFGGADPEENEKMFSDPDTDDSDFWKPNGKHRSGSNSESDSGRNKAAASLQPESDDSVDSDFWKESRKPQSNVKSSGQEATEIGAKYATVLKPYGCTQCNKVFRYSSYLKIHMKQHTERYFCSVCGHRSIYSSNLKVHMRIHTGEKPFSCSFCPKKFSNKASMQSHMSVHYAERKYSCDECKKCFGWYTELKYHRCVGGSSHEQTYEEDADINLKRHILYS
nr:gastrula zinc finger protein xFG20-1 [Nothobranchius furzeri]